MTSIDRSVNITVQRRFVIPESVTTFADTPEKPGGAAKPTASDTTVNPMLRGGPAQTGRLASPAQPPESASAADTSSTLLVDSPSASQTAPISLPQPPLNPLSPSQTLNEPHAAEPAQPAAPQQHPGPTTAELEAEGVEQMLQAEATGNLQQRYSFLYASAPDLRVDEVPVLLRQYKELVLKHEALVCAIESHRAAQQQGQFQSGAGQSPSLLTSAPSGGKSGELRLTCHDICPIESHGLLPHDKFLGSKIAICIATTIRGLHWTRKYFVWVACTATPHNLCPKSSQSVAVYRCALQLSWDAMLCSQSYTAEKHVNDHCSVVTMLQAFRSCRGLPVVTLDIARHACNTACARPHSLTHLSMHQTDILGLVSQVKVDRIGNTMIGRPAKAIRGKPCLNQPSVKLQQKTLVPTVDHQLQLLLSHQGRDPLELNPTFLPCPTQLAAQLASQLAASIRVYQVPNHCRVNQKWLLLPTLHLWRHRLGSRMKLK